MREGNEQWTAYPQDPRLMREFGPCALVYVDGREMEALIATGAAGSYIDMDEAARLGLRESGRHRGEGGRLNREFPEFDAALEIPALDLTLGPPLRGLPLRESGMVWPAVIGQDALKRAELTVDGPSGLVRLKPAGKPTVSVRTRLDISDVDPGGKDGRDPEELLNTFIQEYERRTKELLPGLNLKFEWERTAGAGGPEVSCGCGQGEGECRHALDTRAALETEKPWLDALQSVYDNAPDPQREDGQEERT